MSSKLLECSIDVKDVCCTFHVSPCTLDVEIRPRDALVPAGNTLQLNCTISGFPRNVTSDLIYFRPERPAELGGQRVDVIDHVTSRLSFPGMRRAENFGHVFCYVSLFDEYDHVSFRVAGNSSFRRNRS